MSSRTLPIIDSPELAQGGGTLTESATAKVVTASQIVATGYGDNQIIIGSAKEAVDAKGGGTNTVVGDEAAIVVLDNPSNDKPKIGYNAVAKVRLDVSPQLSGKHPLKNGTAFWASAQPETSFEYHSQAQPGSIEKGFIDCRGHPGLPIITMSGDMVFWKDGVAYELIIIDGKKWGKKLTYLDD